MTVGAAGQAGSAGAPRGEAVRVDARSEESFDAFVTARAPALLRTAYLLTGDHHLAEDLVQTAMFKTAKVWPRITGSPEPYVRRVLYNENVSRWRRRRHVTEVPERLAPEPASPTGDHDLTLVLRAALARLTPKQRTVLVLRYFEDLSESQVAAVLGIGLGTVKSQTRHALRRLRLLAPELVDLVEVGGDD